MPYLATPRTRADSNDVNIPVVQYANDKTLITVVNGTHLLTRIYYTSADLASSGCVSNTVPGAFPPANPFTPSSYMGRVMWNNVECDAWADGPEVFFVDVSKGAFVGGRTSDSSQLVTFLYFQRE